MELSRVKESGLYLLFPDGTTLALTPSVIEERSVALLSGIARQVRESPGFQLCSICPKSGMGSVCTAIQPILAFWEDIDRHFSYAKVTAAYRDATSGNITVADTTLQRALQYLSILSLMHYCEVGKKYWQYFYGVHPLMDTDDVVARVYLNMYWTCEGDVVKTRALIGRFHDEISVTTHCQMERIRRFCSHDAFLNALILTQLASEFLADHAQDIIQRRVAAFERMAFGVGLACV